MTSAHSETMEMLMATCSLSAFTAPPTAMDADTPHTAPPAPSTAAKRLSRPNTRVATKNMVSHVVSETMVACRNATGPAVTMAVSGRVAPSSTIPVLM